MFGEKKNMWSKSNKIVVDLEGQIASAFLDKKWKILAKVVHYY